MKTNKYLYRVSLMMGFAALCSLSSCGEDDDSADTYKNTKPMRVSKITQRNVDLDTNESFSTVYNFVYANNGNLEKIIYDGYRDGDYTFSYESNKVTMKVSYGKTYTYDLKDGNVLRREDQDQFTHSTYTTLYDYDSNGYLTMEKTYSSGYERVYSFIWENGNMTKCTEYSDGSYTINITYSNIPWPQNFSMYLLVYGDSDASDLFLHPLGIWGKNPKYLPSKNEIYDEYGNLDRYSCTIDYVMKEGLLTTMQTRYIQYNYTKFFDIEWEEIPAK